MVANIEVVDGRANFASRRVPAWHGLGTVFTEDLSPMEMLKEANMTDWNIRAIPLETMLPPGVSSDLNKVVIVRDNPFYSAELAEDAETNGYEYDQTPYNALGVTGKDYFINQNEDLADFGSYLLSGGRGETAGSIDNGKTVFMTLALETETIIDAEGANDKVNQYLMISTSHNGTSALVAGVTPVRVVCQNTLNIALRGMENQVKIRHTKSMQERMDAAKATLKLATNYIAHFEEMAVDLYEQSVTDKQFFDIIKAVYPEPDTTKAATTRWQAKVDTLMQIWEGPTEKTIKNTGWGALNALTEDQQWNRGVYNNNVEKFLVAGAGLDDAANKDRNRIAKVVKELVLA